jgi:predicted S18 family serine protease
MISGTINSVGEIGAVGGLLEKAKTAKVHGATLFLVPGGQGGRISELVEECEIVGNKEICDSKFVEKDADLSAEAGIEVIEVWTIGEAMGYLLK